MTFRKQMLLLAGFPALGLFMAGTLLCVLKFMEYREARDSRQRVAEAGIISELVHVLQVERGQSAGYLASGGENFAEILPRTRVRVDDVVARLSGGRVDVTSLAQLRRTVDGTDAAVPEVVSSYTDLVRHVLETGEKLIILQTNPELARLGAGLVGVAEAKEAAGQQRAAGATGLSAGVFDAATFRAFVERGAVEASYLKTASLELADALDSLDFDRVRVEIGVAEVQKAITEAGSGAFISSVSAPEWFDMSTAWIEKLRGVETRVYDRMAGIAAASARQAATLLICTIALSGLTFVITLLIARKVLTGLNTRLTAFAGELSRIGERDFSARPGRENDGTEFGAMFKAIETTKENLRISDERLQEADRDRASVIASLSTAMEQLAQGDLALT
ncbi:MAG: nitrate- and nitrite sensing domain-containing protein, partial [Pseudomonadota bacterium]